MSLRRRRWKITWLPSRDSWRVSAMFRRRRPVRRPKQLFIGQTFTLPQFYHRTVNFTSSPGLPLRTIAWTVSSELLGFCFYFSPYFFASVPCARLSWPSRQLFSTRWYTVPYRIVFTSFPSEGVLMCGGAKGSGLRSRGSGFNSRSRSGCVPTLDKLFTEEHPMQKIVSDQIVVFWGKSKGMRSSCDGV